MKAKIDKTIWKNKWFRNLPPSLKLFWLYLLSVCDSEGMWRENLKLASYIIGEKLDRNEVIKTFADHVKIMDNGKWKIIGFVEEKENEQKLNANAKWVIEQLNRIAGKNYQCVESNLRHVRQRLRDHPGITGRDFIRVIEYKTRQWKGTEMEKYLRPETLFGTKFDGYLNESVPYRGSNKWMIGI